MPTQKVSVLRFDSKSARASAAIFKRPPWRLAGKRPSGEFITVVVGVKCGGPNSNIKTKSRPALF